MNYTNFEHAVYALLMQLPFALLGHWWVGAFVAISFFIGREHAQAQGRGTNKLSDLAAFDVRGWSLDARLDLAFPTIACLVVAVCWHFFR